MSYGLTSREKAIWPPKGKKIDTTTLLFIFAVLCCIIAAIVHFTVEPKGTEPIVNVAHADTETLPDRVQELKYCKAWNKSTVHVGNATNMQIASHCAYYLN